jgi:hypothetical protein
MNKIKIDNYYKPESKTLRLDEVDYTIIPNSDIKPLLDKLEQENKILKENAEHNDKVVDKVNWENQLLKKENKQLKDELKSKPDAQITLQDDKGNKFMVIQTERIDMQVELNKTIEKLFNNWNKLKEWVNKHYDYYINNEDYVGGRLCFNDMKDKMQELEGSDSNDSN